MSLQRIALTLTRRTLRPSALLRSLPAVSNCPPQPARVLMSTHQATSDGSFEQSDFSFEVLSEKTQRTSYNHVVGSRPSVEHEYEPVASDVLPTKVLCGDEYAQEMREYDDEIGKYDGLVRQMHEENGNANRTQQVATTRTGKEKETVRHLGVASDVLQVPHSTTDPVLKKRAIRHDVGPVMAEDLLHHE